MADFGGPVVDPRGVNPMQTLSQVLNIKQQQQQLQTGKFIQQQAQATAAQEQQTAGQRSGIASFMSTFDPTQHVGPDGTLDLDQVLTDPKLRQAAGDQFPALMQQMVQVKQSQLQAKQQLVNLNDSTRTQFQGLLGGLRTDPDVIADNPAGREKVQRTVGEFAASGDDAARIANIYGTVLQHVPQGKMAQTVSNMQLQAMDAAAQSGRQAPSYANAGNRLVQANPQAAGGAPAGNIATGIPPQRLYDPVSHTFYDTPGTGGGGAAPSAGAGNSAGPPAATPTPGAPHYEPGEASVIDQNTNSVTQNRKMAADAQIQSDILNRIQGIASTPGLYIGPGSQTVAQAATALAGIPGFEKAAQYANNYNELVKFMAQNAARMGAQMGLEGSDARLSLAMHSQPNDTMDPRTIQSVSQYLSGLVKMQLAKTDAMDHWLAKPGNSQRNEQNFERLWRDNADPRLFQMAVMKDQGQANEYSKLHIRKNELEALQKKHDVLVALGALD